MRITFSAKEEKTDEISNDGFQFTYCYLLAIAKNNPALWLGLKNVIKAIDKEVA